jgi:hypothetical protein
MKIGLFSGQCLKECQDKVRAKVVEKGVDPKVSSIGLMLAIEAVYEENERERQEGTANKEIGEEVGVGETEAKVGERQEVERVKEIIDLKLSAREVGGWLNEAIGDYLLNVRGKKWAVLVDLPGEDDNMWTYGIAHFLRYGLTTIDMTRRLPNGGSILRVPLSKHFSGGAYKDSGEFLRAYAKVGRQLGNVIRPPRGEGEVLAIENAGRDWEKYPIFGRRSEKVVG